MVVRPGFLLFFFLITALECRHIRHPHRLVRSLDFLGSPFPFNQDDELAEEQAEMLSEGNNPEFMENVEIISLVTTNEEDDEEDSVDDSSLGISVVTAGSEFFAPSLKLAASVGRPLFKIGNSLLKPIVKPAGKGLKKLFKPLSKVAKPLLGPLAKTAKPILGPLHKILKPLSGLLPKISKSLLGRGKTAKPVLGSLAKSIKPLLGPLSKTSKPLLKALAPLSSSLFPITSLTGNEGFSFKSFGSDVNAIVADGHNFLLHSADVGGSILLAKALAPKLVKLLIKKGPKAPALLLASATGFLDSLLIENIESDDDEQEREGTKVDSVLDSVAVITEEDTDESDISVPLVLVDEEDSDDDLTDPELILTSLEGSNETAPIFLILSDDESPEGILSQLIASLTRSAASPILFLNTLGGFDGEVGAISLELVEDVNSDDIDEEDSANEIMDAEESNADAVDIIEEDTDEDNSGDADEIFENINEIEETNEVEESERDFLEDDMEGGPGDTIIVLEPIEVVVDNAETENDEAESTVTEMMDSDEEDVIVEEDDDTTEDSDSLNNEVTSGESNLAEEIGNSTIIALANIVSIKSKLGAPVVNLGVKASAPFIKAGAKFISPFIHFGSKVAAPGVKFGASLAAPLVKVGTKFAGPIFLLGSNAAHPILKEIQNPFSPSIHILKKSLKSVTKALRPIHKAFVTGIHSNGVHKMFAGKAKSAFIQVSILGSVLKKRINKAPVTKKLKGLVASGGHFLDSGLTVFRNISNAVTSASFDSEFGTKFMASKSPGEGVKFGFHVTGKVDDGTSI